MFTWRRTKNTGTHGTAHLPQSTGIHAQSVIYSKDYALCMKSPMSLFASHGTYTSKWPKPALWQSPPSSWPCRWTVFLSLSEEINGPSCDQHWHSNYFYCQVKRMLFSLQVVYCIWNCQAKIIVLYGHLQLVYKLPGRVLSLPFLCPVFAARRIHVVWAM